MIITDIGWAVKQLRKLNLVRRRGWNGKGMYLFFLPEGEWHNVEDDHTVDFQDHVAMFTAQGNCVPWLCSQSDLLATDWEIAD
jgi:hypothetical protein